MSDPLSITCSILSFYDSADALKETSAKLTAGTAKERLLERDVVCELSELEINCQIGYSTLNSFAAIELKDALDGLQKDHAGVQGFTPAGESTGLSDAAFASNEAEN
ncbi:hypothetical protein HGRIS_011998 [Hohenbuehelia grisea]|uniref:Uncharacterized protein n=1 Tax=Hohenbuehelia grisea TaxID=104357 RepID=A0ABR3JXN7_9AGAR